MINNALDRKGGCQRASELPQNDGESFFVIDHADIGDAVARRHAFRRKRQKIDTIVELFLSGFMQLPAGVSSTPSPPRRPVRLAGSPASGGRTLQNMASSSQSYVAFNVPAITGGHPNVEWSSIQPAAIGGSAPARLHGQAARPGCTARLHGKASGYTIRGSLVAGQVGFIRLDQAQRALGRICWSVSWDAS
jgi:hypothetical protein